MPTTVTYTYPVSGTVPPTAIQASRVPTVIGTVSWDFSDGDFALFTHNLGIATSPGFAGRQPSIADGFPEVILSPLNITNDLQFSPPGYTVIDGNVIQVAHRSAFGGNYDLRVTVRAPHSMGL